MEVTSSTMTSDSQEASDQYLTATSMPETTLSTTRGSQEGFSSGGLNNAASVDVGTNSVETVRYGPSLPPAYYSSDTTGYSKDVRDSKALQGSCGLYNLGNTCFMNAGIQSLVSCAPLVKYFCDNYLLTDSNRLTLTAQFYILLCKMWSGKFSVVHPRKFKESLGFYHSQFEDYRQHDCQEFLALLLDTLHEQLNNASVPKGSYTSSPQPLASSLSSSPSSQPFTFPAGACGVSAIPTTTTDLDSDFQLLLPHDKTEEEGAAREGFGLDDLNNKDSICAVINPVLSLMDGAEVQNGSKFSGFAHPLVVRETGQSPCYPNEGSPTSDVSVSDLVVTSPSSQCDVTSQKSLERDEEEEMISSTFPPLKRYVSRSNLDDVTSTDSSVVVKPYLKRVSSGSSVTTCGALFHSEDSNQSTISAHSTDSEQSSAFKRLKIDTSDMNRNSNNNIKECVTSTSDCKKTNKSRKNILNDTSVLRDTGHAIVSGSVPMSCPQKDLSVIDNMVTSCQDGLCLDVKICGAENHDTQAQLSPGLLDDFYKKETKTLNTNVLVSEFLQEITSDSEKFAKVDNRHRPPTKEINLLQEAFGEEDKTEKVLIGQRLGGVKDTNLYAHSTTAIIKPAVKMLDPNVLNNSIGLDGISAETISKISPQGNDLTPVDDLLPNLKLREEEKNIQMQAYSKFNTIPVHSNIRTDLIDSAPDADSMEIDEVEVECSEDEEIDSSSHLSSLECSSVPNCLRHCPSSEMLMANKAWNDYLAKNDSIVVNTFQGQFRSTVVCSECSHVSVTYEPFMYLSLPIPHAMDQQICVVYVSQNRPPVRYLLNLQKTDKIGTVKKRLCEVMNHGPSDVIMAEVLDSHISRILDDNILLKYVNTFNRKIYAFEIISAESGASPPADENASCNLLLNNDLELPSSSRLELPLASHSQSSNHSFDSVNVNSPSSRDSPDYMFSDSELCDPSSQDNADFSARYVEEDNDGQCQSSTSLTGTSPWVYGGFSNNRRLSWTMDDYDGGVDTGRKSSTATSTVTTNSTGYWTEHGEAKAGPEGLGGDDSGLVTDTLRAAKSLCGSSDDGPSSEAIAVAEPVSATVATQGSLGGSCSNSGRNTSRSCPSPETFSHAPEHDTTLLSVAAAKLEGHPGSYFLNPTQNDTDYGYFQESATSNTADTSCTLMEQKQDRSWASGFNTKNSSQDESIRPTTHQWRSCAICLEDLLDTELLTHVSCDGVFCQPCLEMSVKHTADISAFSCPICLNPANSMEDFVPLATASVAKPKVRTLPMSIAYRHNVRDNSGMDCLQLFGHPSILHMPSVMSGDSLYSLVDRLVSPLLSTYSIKLTDGQGLTCSRCTYSRHCSGCEIAREGEVILQPSDCLTIHMSDSLSPDQVCEWQYVHEDSSMAGLRSSEPTTIMDCFGAFTQSEILDEHNPWYCPQCERNQCAKKTMTVWRYPDNLIIHLKRFVYQDLSSTKVDTKIIFPHEGMDVRGFLSGPGSSGLTYDLYSIVCHFGGASAGHYTSYSKHPLTSQWYYYNDESVSQQTPSESEYSSGYVLFYQRRGTGVVFSLPSTIPSFDDDTSDNPVPGSAHRSSNGGGNSMALVLYQPPTTSGQQDNMVDDDYDGERRHASCDEDSVVVHFGSTFPAGGKDIEEVVSGAEAQEDSVLIAEPDSTLEFYS